MNEIVPGSEDAGPWIQTVLAVWTRGQSRSMVGPGNPSAHLQKALSLASAVGPAPARALDLGSGAGIPGLALAGHWPDSRWTLLDAARRRVELLEDAVGQLGWGDRVKVVHGRAEDVGRDPAHREVYDLVTSRSFGPPAVTAECGGAFVRVGGTLAVTEPPETGDSARWPGDGVAVLGLALGARVGSVQLLRRVVPEDPRFPRRPGVPAKRPLF